LHDSFCLFTSKFIRSEKILCFFHTILDSCEELRLEMELLRAVVDQVTLEFPQLSKVNMPEVEVTMLSAIFINHKYEIINRSGTNVNMLENALPLHGDFYNTSENTSVSRSKDLEKIPVFYL